MVQKYLPDPFLFCIILTGITLLMAIPLTGQGFFQMTVHWGNGFWGLLMFSMQMALVLVLGNAMATSPPIAKLLRLLASIPKTPAAAIIMVTIVSYIASWINWGFGLVVGALYAREIARLGRRVDYRLLIASAYTGFLSWHGGLSGSVPLMIASFNDTVRAQTGGVLTESIPIQQTIFATYNLVILFALLILIPLVNAKMHPRDEDVVLINPDLLKEDEYIPEKSTSPATWMENSRLLSLFVVFLGGVVLYNYFSKSGFAALNLNTVNLLFLIVGVLLHGTPIRYVRAINKGVAGAGGILLQFPFYGGIMGMMSGLNPETGLSLAKVISDAFASVSTPQTWPFLSFLSCTFINLFIPSGGGQWAVQGPIIMPAGQTLGVAPAITAMSYVWGDSWTNMIQPFWALPALGIAGLGARDIMGFCVVALIASGVVIWSVFLLVGFGFLV